MNDHAKVTGTHAAANSVYRELETKVEVWDLTDHNLGHESVVVEFTLDWGTSGHRVFEINGGEDVYMVAGVLATALGMYLTDEDPDEIPPDGSV